VTYRRLLTTLIAPFAIALAAGCQGGNTPPAPAGPPKATGPSEADKVRAALGKLSTDDRKLAEAQILCPVTDEELGSMGVPVKLTIKDQPVFVCCKGCGKDAEKDPDGTLKKVAELKAKAAK
jgi:hypothetical protein